ncbi:MAG: hypothetical protein HY209_03135, partial [Candidatus Omnitrophica bacterium]|nr:hypothetical protein [Candidatus Omnitrophota bacterium]
NYTLTQPTTTANVTARDLTVTASDQSKTYGNAALGTTAFTSSGLQNGETIGAVTLSTNATLSTSGNYNAGTWTITPSAASAGTFTASNYTITYANAPTGLTINKLALSAAIADSSSVYADSLNPGTASFSNIVGSDDVSPAVVTVNTSTTSSSGNFVAGSYTQSISSTLSGADKANYSLTGGFTSSANYTIDKLALTGAAIAGSSSVYGSSLNPGAVSFDNIISGDDVTGTASVNTSTTSTSGNPIVGSYTQSTGTSLSGADSGNYSLSNFTSSANYTISKLAITGTAIGSGSSVYGSSLNPGTVSFGNIVGADDVSAAASVNTSTLSTSGNPIVGSYTQSTSTGALSGADSGNYTVSFTSEANYTITAKQLTVGGSFTVNDKVYDGTTDATINTNNLTLNGVVGTEAVTLTPVVAFSDNGASNGKTVGLTVASFLGGVDFGNYILSLVSAPTATANITSSSPPVVNTAQIFNGALQTGESILYGQLPMLQPLMMAPFFTTVPVTIMVVTPFGPMPMMMTLMSEMPMPVEAESVSSAGPMPIATLPAIPAPVVPPSVSPVLPSQLAVTSQAIPAQLLSKQAVVRSTVMPLSPPQIFKNVTIYTHTSTPLYFRDSVITTNISAITNLNIFINIKILSQTR